jgi:hypothetical protein
MMRGSSSDSYQLTDNTGDLDDLIRDHLDGTFSYNPANGTFSPDIQAWRSDRNFSFDSNQDFDLQTASLRAHCNH